MKYEIPLSEAGIQAIINGREVNKKLPDGTELVIRQSLKKNMEFQQKKHIKWQVSLLLMQVMLFVSLGFRY